MPSHFQHHSVSFIRYEDGSTRVSHVHLDSATRRAISENLNIPEPTDSGPWSWEEQLLLGVSELLMRREEQQLELW